MDKNSYEIRFCELISASLSWPLAWPPPYPAAPDFPPKGKRLTTFCASLSLLHPLLSLTHWILRSLRLPYKSSSLVQNVFTVHPRESVSHDSQVALLPYSTAITDSQYFARHCVPSKYVRWCDSCSLATPSGGQNKTSLCFPTESCNTTASVHSAPSKRGGKGTGVTPANWIRRGA